MLCVTFPAENYLTMNDLVSLSIPLLLASQSPRRRALLEQVGLPFTTQVSPADESTDGSAPPRETARQLALRKARPVAREHPRTLVLAADTIVIHQDEVLEKPASAQEAHNMLRRLSDTTHTVYTGLALHLYERDRVVSTGCDTKVTFAALEDNEIRTYVASGSPMDKAGGYGIQDHTAPFFVDDLEGDYYNVVGLPLRHLYVTLRQHFSDLLAS